MTVRRYRNWVGQKGQADPYLDRGKPFELDYDKLVIAVGAYSNTFNTPGVKEHAIFLKQIDDARKIRSRILECKHF